jgi:hypothetical protein
VARNWLCTAIRAKRYADVPDIVFVLVSVMAPELPIYWCPFIVVGDIGHERPTNLLSVDELRWWIVIWFVFGFQFFGNSVGRPIY